MAPPGLYCWRFSHFLNNVKTPYSPGAYTVLMWLADSDLLSSLRWYHAPALLMLILAFRIQKDCNQQLQKLRRNRFGTLYVTAIFDPFVRPAVVGQIVSLMARPYNSDQSNKDAVDKFLLLFHLLHPFLRSPSCAHTPFISPSSYQFSSPSLSHYLPFFLPKSS